MARKKTETPSMPAPATAPAPPAADKPVRLILPPDVHRLFRLIAADDGTTMASLSKDVIASYVREEAKRRGIK
jgi:hypothetical protein